MTSASARYMYCCAHCSQQFTRKEHLQRHQAKHGSIQFFECKKCFRRFTRSDVLRRHERTHVLHDEARLDPANRISSDRKVRVSIACDECARTKVRCDGQFPCGQCRRKALFCTLNRPHPAVKRQRSGTMFSPSLINGRFTGTPVVREPPCSTTAASEPAIRSQMSNIDATPVTDMPVNAMCEQDLVELDDFDPDLHFLEDLPFPFLVPSQGVFDDGVPNLPWPVENFPSEDEESHNETSAVSAKPSEQTTEQPQSRCVVGTSHTSTSYANCPFEYQFKRGPTVNANRIYKFLHNRSSWTKVNVVSVCFKSTEAPVPRVFGSSRDAIAARIHGMLYRLLDRNAIPSRFPPLETVQSCFFAFHKSFLPLYPIFHPSTFSDSDGDTDDDRYADTGLLLTTIMALGCLVVPVEEAQAFSMELVYLLRFTISDNAFQDEACLSDKWVLSAWIMMLVFSAWSGNRRHMEMAEAFKGVPSAYFRRRGFYRACSPSPKGQHEMPSSWSSWIEKERDLRMCQVLFLLDHEISLLHCIQPALNFTQINCPMPVSDELFLLDCEEEWRALINQWARDSTLTSKLTPPSLASLYSIFLDRNMVQLDLSLTPLHLRLLLCAIQSQVTQHAQCQRFIPLEERFASDTPLLKTDGLVKLYQQEEFEHMLMKWSLLADRVFAYQPFSQHQVSGMLISQLVWLELYICFDDVQLIAGKEGYEVGRNYLPHLRRWSQSTSARKAIAHAANVIRILQTNLDNRPVWWPITVSRVALVMWCYVVGVYLSTGSPAGVHGAVLSWTTFIALNDPTKDWNPQGRMVLPDEGVPCIRSSCGKLIPLHEVPKIFDLCIQLLRDCKGPNSPILGSTWQFLEDIKNRGIPYAYSENSIS